MANVPSFREITDINDQSVKLCEKKNQIVHKEKSDPTCNPHQRVAGKRVTEMKEIFTLNAEWGQGKS